MAYDPNRHHRRTIRLKEYDYSLAGYYFVTVCASGRKCLFGDVAGEEMRANHPGEIVIDTLYGMPKHYPHIVLDESIVMPNHVHFIIGISVGAGLKPALPRTAGLPEVVRAFKTFSARRINELRKSSGVPVWQRNYYEHIIRNGKSLNLTREYIIDNPARWEVDRENPAIERAGLKPAPTEEEPWRI
ncbi:MAG: transposase [Nitrospinae bacterium]|nr:transposase [Nitrospinota bacterium]